MRWALLLLLAACGGPEPGSEALPEADFDGFVQTVQPVFARRCANPSCHGRFERPLAVFAEQQFRAEPGDVFVDVPLTEDELRANFDAARAFLLDISTTDECLLLTKPLAAAAGGVRHAGGTLFEDAADPEARALSTWVRAALREGQP